MQKEMARSRPSIRQPKKGGSCPCIQDKEMKETEERQATQQEPRFVVADIYHPNDEFVDLESFSEASSFGQNFVDPLESNTIQEISGVGDQFEEATYLSGGNISS
jgi:hypothetical protein